MKASEVFEVLRDGKPRTRAQLARETGVARSTIASRIDLLIRLGLVAPHGDDVSTGGRPPSLLAVNSLSRVVAGVDVGASHVTVGLSDLSGAMLDERRVDMDVASGPEAVLGWAVTQIGELMDAQGRPVDELAGIGIGLPGPVEHVTGRPINPPIMPGWDAFDVPAHAQRTYAVPVLVDNDVNLMALGEWSAHLRPVADLIFVKVSTGIGAGLILGGVLQRGAQGSAGDLGHVRVARADEVLCRCGNEGCLEAVAGGPALARRLREAGLETRSGLDVVAAVRAGDVRADRALRQAGRDIGEVASTLINVINPSAIIVGGILADAGESLIAGIREVVYQRSAPLATRHLTVITSQAGERAAVLGAAALAIEHVLSPAAIDAASLADEAALAPQIADPVNLPLGVASRVSRGG